MSNSSSIVFPSKSEPQEKPSAIAGGSPTSSTSSSLAPHDPTDLSPPTVPTASRKRQTDPDSPYKPSPSARKVKASKPSKPTKKKLLSLEDQAAGTDATQSSTRLVSTPKISQACKACRFRKTKCSGVFEGGSCDQCQRAMLVCELDPKGSNDRAASSRQ